MGFVSFILTALYVPTFPAGATVPRWAFLAVIVPAIMVYRNTYVPRTALAIFMYVTIMAFWATNPYSALNDYLFFCILLGTFCIAYSTKPGPAVFIGAALGLWVNSFVVLGQFAGLWQMAETAPYSGLFMNRNGAVEAAAMLVPALVFYNRLWLILGLLPTLAAGARAPILALGAVGLFMVWGYSRWLAIGLSAALAILGFAFLGHDTASMVERLNVWRDTVQGLTWLGHGLGAFSAEFSTLQVHTDGLLTRFDHPHMEALQVLYEFGAGGVVLIGLLVFRMSRDPSPSAPWYALFVFLVEGCFSFPLYNPVTGFLAAVCLGYLCRYWADVRATVAFSRCCIPRRDEHADNRALCTCSAAIPAQSDTPFRCFLCSRFAP